jgi:hypothetical protein
LDEFQSQAVSNIVPVVEPDGFSDRHREGIFPMPDDFTDALLALLNGAKESKAPQTFEGALLQASISTSFEKRKTNAPEQDRFALTICTGMAKLKSVQLPWGRPAVAPSE